MLILAVFLGLQNRVNIPLWEYDLSIQNPKCPKAPDVSSGFHPDIYRGEVEDLPHVGHGSNHSYLGPGLLVAINGDLFVGKRMGWGTPNYEHTHILSD